MLITSLNSKEVTDIALQESELTLRRASEGTLIKALVKEDKKETFKLIFSLIERMQQSFSFNNKMSDAQITTCAFDLMELMAYESLEDIVLLFKMARQGQLGGKIFRVDSHIITQEWLPVYMDLKAEELEMQQKEKKTIDLMSKEEWSEESQQKLEELNKKLHYDRMERKKSSWNHITTSPLNNSELFIKELKFFVETATKKELNKMLEKYGNRRENAVYVQIVKDELERRNEGV